MAPLTLIVNGTRRRVDLPGDTPLLWALRDSARPDRHEVRLRRRPLRRLHGPPRRGRGALVHAFPWPRPPASGSRPSRGSRRTARIPSSAPGWPRTWPSAATARRARSWPPRRCSARRLGRRDEPDRRRDVRQPVPLRHLPADPRRDPSRRRRGGLMRRRDFVQVSATAAGGLLVPVSLPAGLRRAFAADGPPAPAALGAFIEIAADGIGHHRFQESRDRPGREDLAPDAGGRGAGHPLGAGAGGAGGPRPAIRRPGRRRQHRR